ncbi:glycosyltransferase family protein [Winogradskyella sp.]|nr:glycosyltransferase family protein [Winogradskyella sp.]
MLSIIICSVQKDLLSTVKQNITKTVGCTYEVIDIDNALNKYSIAEAYNLGAKKATYKNLLFIHEDVAFHTQNWGEALVNLLQQTDIGLIGISGVTYKTQHPVTWSMVPQKYYRINAIQRWKSGRTEKIIQKDHDTKPYSEVVVIDGVFMAMRLDVWQNQPFDEDHIKGFHLYDMDQSLKIGKSYKIVVTHAILVEHFSQGSTNAIWIKESLKWHKAKASHLPLSVKPISSKEKRHIAHYALIGFCFVLIRNNCNLLAVLYWFKAFFIVPSNKSNLDALKYLLKNTLNKK